MCGKDFKSYLEKVRRYIIPCSGGFLRNRCYMDNFFKGLEPGTGGAEGLP